MTTYKPSVNYATAGVEYLDEEKSLTLTKPHSPAAIEEAQTEAYNQGIKDAQAKILWMLGGNKTLEELGVELADGHNAEGSQMLCAYWAIGDLKK